MTVCPTSSSRVMFGHWLLDEEKYLLIYPCPSVLATCGSDIFSASSWILMILMMVPFKPDHQQYCSITLLVCLPLIVSNTAQDSDTLDKKPWRVGMMCQTVLQSVICQQISWKGHESNISNIVTAILKKRAGGLCMEYADNFHSMFVWQHVVCCHVSLCKIICTTFFLLQRTCKIVIFLTNMIQRWWGFIKTLFCGFVGDH